VAADDGGSGARRRKRKPKAAAGGARAQPHRKRHGKIIMPEAVNVLEAWRFAIRMGWPLSMFVSINWALAPSSRFPDPVARIARFRDCMKSWLRRAAPGWPFVWIEAREKPRAEGEGIHIAVAVPHELRSSFAAMVARWVAADADYFVPGAADVRPVGPRWWDRLAYMLKGSEPDVYSRFGCGRFGKPYQGAIYGPRVRVAHAIGPTARRAAEKALEAALALGAEYSPAQESNGHERPSGRL
jgi:hypothetical protein